jgi:HAD superfamily phosphatase (TIGR01668 family)
MIFLRAIFAIKQAWHFRAQLKRYIFDPNLQLANVREITPEYLNQRGVAALVLDYDGVLAAHGSPTPRADVIAWLQDLTRAYAPHKIYILSNKPTFERAEFFAQHLPEIIFVKAKRKKPYPDGLEQILAMSGLSASQILLVDDRLLTGVLATLIAGTQACWITKPYVDLRARPLAEGGIMFLRWIERTALSI